MISGLGQQGDVPNHIAGRRLEAIAGRRLEAIASGLEAIAMCLCVFLSLILFF